MRRRAGNAKVRCSAAYPTGAERIENFLPNLFWDADSADLDFSKHRKYVVQRVLEKGTLDDMRHMLTLLTLSNLWLANNRHKGHFNLLSRNH